jgi:hypothetical protein
MPILGTIASSRPSGFALNWSTATAGSSNTLGAYIGFGNNIFLIGPRTTGTNYFTSSNGTSWTERTAPANIEPGGWAGAYFVYFVFGTSTFYKTSNGISWTSGTVTNGVQSGRWSGPLTTDGTNGSSTVALQSVNVGQLQCARTTDGGDTWTGGSLQGASNFNGLQISYGGSGNWAYCGELSQLGYSSDGINFSRVSTPSGNAGAIFGGSGGGFIFRSDTAGTTYYTSTNGSSWTSRTFPVSGIYQFGWSGTRWIASVNSGTATYSSTDGINWTAATGTAKSSGTSHQYAFAPSSFTGAGKIVIPNFATNTVNYTNS